MPTVDYSAISDQVLAAYEATPEGKAFTDSPWHPFRRRILERNMPAIIDVVAQKLTSDHPVSLAGPADYAALSADVMASLPDHPNLKAAGGWLAVLLQLLGSLLPTLLPIIIALLGGLIPTPTPVPKPA